MAATGRTPGIRAQRSTRWHAWAAGLLLVVLVAGSEAAVAQLRWRFGIRPAALIAFSLSSNPAQNLITTIAGSGRSFTGGDNGQAVFASMDVDDVAVDAAGNIYLAGFGTARIRKIAPDGTITTVAGTGTAGFGGDGGPATSALLSAINAITVDSSGNLIIADTQNQRVRRVTPGGTITTIAGNGTGGFGGDGGPGDAAQLLYPSDVVADGAGNIFIADTSNFRVRKLSSDGTITTVAGSGIGFIGGDGGPAVQAKIVAGGVGLDGLGNLLILDLNNHRIRKVNSGGIITTIAGSGFGSFGDGGPATSAGLKYPCSVVGDGLGNIYVADNGNYSIRRIDSAGVIQTIAGTGVQGFSGDGGPAISAQLGSPNGLAFDGTGALLVADSFSHRLRKIRMVAADEPRIASIVPSTGSQGSVIRAKLTGANLDLVTGVSFSGSGVSGSISSVNSPTSLTASITISPSAAPGPRTVRVTTASQQSEAFISFTVGSPIDDRVITTVAGTGSSGFSGDGGPATSAALNEPVSVAKDAAGNLYIADSLNHRVRKVTPAGVISTVAGTGAAGFSGDNGPATLAKLNRPRDVALDAVGNLFIADTFNSRVRKVAPDGQITTFAGNGTAAYGGDGSLATAASLSDPGGVAIDALGRVFIGDSANSRVRLVDVDGVISTVAGTGTQGFSGDGGPANQARLFGPTRLAINVAGDLFFVDSGNGRVRKVNSAGVISTVAGNGATNGSVPGEGSLATSGKLSPSGIAVDSAGILFIAGLQYVWRVDTGGLIYSVAGRGPTAGDNVPPTLVALSSVEGLAVDRDGNLFIAESGTSRIRAVSLPGAGTRAPSFTSITPSSLPQGSTITGTISGLNFIGVSSVVFGGTGVTAEILSGGTAVSAPVRISVTPGADLGSHSVTVATADGISNTVAGFTVTAPTTPMQPAPGAPFVTTSGGGALAITTLTAPQGSKVAATLFGFNYDGATAVTFGGTGVTATILGGGTSTSIPMAINVDSTASLGDHTVTVTTPAGGSNSRSGFTVISPVAPAYIATAAGMECCAFSSGNQLGPAITRPLLSPTGLAADRAGTIFFSEGNRVRSIDSLGVFNTIAGQGRFTGFIGDGGPALQAGLGSSGDVAVDSTGNVFIVDAYRVRKVSSITGIITTVAGNGESEIGVDGVPATSTGFLSISDIAVDDVGNLFIADSNRVRMVNASGIISTVAGNGTTGFSGDGGPATSAQLSTNLHIALDAAHNVFIADYDNNRIRKVDSAGMISTVAGNGTQGFGGDGNAATAAQIYRPFDVALDTAGNVFIMDAYARVRLVNTAGIISTIAGGGGGSDTEFVPATSVALSIDSMAVDANGNLWLADGGTNRIRKVTRVAPPVPSITSAGPSSGTQGTIVQATIFGSNLSGAAAVQFSGSGVSGTIGKGGNETSIPLTITIDPTAAPGPRNLTVYTQNSVSLPFNAFTVGVPTLPRISSITPSSAVQGTSVPVTIAGANLSAATSLNLSGSGISVSLSPGGSDTGFGATLTISPSASTGVRNATVTTANGTSAAFDGFAVTPSTPVISSLSVLSGEQGATFPASITGTNLAAVTSLAFSGPGVNAVISGTPTDTSVPVVISISMGATAGGRTLIAATADKLSAPLNGFTVLQSNVPSITGMTPLTVVRGSVVSGAIVGFNLANSTGVTISGSGVSAVISGNVTSTRVPVAISVASNAAPGSRAVSVSTSGPTSNTLIGLSVDAGNPIRITSITPASVMQGSPFSARIYGTNLGNASTVDFGGGITAVVTSSTPTSVFVTGTVSTNASAGNRTFTVTTPIGASDAFNSLRVVSAPRPSLITTVIGTGVSGYSGDGYNASALKAPTGVAFDGVGNVFIADSGNNRIRKITPKGVISTVAGTGTAGFSGDGGLAVAADIWSPGGIAIDASGNLFFADTGNNRVRKVNPAGTISTVAGTGTAGFSGDGGPAINAALSGPNSVAIDNNGNLLIADTFNDRIRRLKSDGTIETVAGTSFAGFGGDGGPSTSGTLSLPTGVAVDVSGRILIADFLNHRIRAISGGTISTIAGSSAGFSGDGGPAVSAKLFSPLDVRGDAAGNIYIADYDNGRVRRIDAGGTIATIAGVGTYGYSGDGGPGTAAMINGPFALAADSAGSLLIADLNDHRIRKLASTGTITTFAGSGVGTFVGDGPASIFAQISAVSGDTAVDPAGNLIVADIDNNRIRKVTPEGVVSTIAGTGSNGFSGDGGPANAAMISDLNAVAVDGTGNVYISGGQRIRKIAVNGIITTIVGTGTAGFSGDGGPASIASIYSPAGMAIDQAGNLFFADYLNQRVRMVAPSGVITTVAGNGTNGFSGDDGLATSASLSGPVDVAVDGSGNIYIADYWNNRIRRVDTSGTITTFAGTGASDFGGDDDPATTAQLSSPSHVALDPAGNVFIGDSGNARVRMVSPSGIITTVAGNGGFSFSGDGGQATSAQMRVGGIGVDGRGNLFIAGDHRVREVMFTNSGSLPQITGISPFYGAQGTVVAATISGSSLAGATAVIFTGTGVTASLQAGGTATSIPIVITIAAGASIGLRNVHVTTNDGVSEAFSGFTVTSSLVAPSVTRISPIKGYVGANVPAVISGSALSGATAVTFSGTGVSASIEPGGSDTGLPVTIAIASDASLSLRVFTVTTPAGTSGAFNGFTAVRPVITSIAPTAGTPGFTFPVTLTGQNLLGATSVSIAGGGVSAAIASGGTDTSLPLTISVASDAAPGVRDVIVHAGSAASAVFTGFTVFAFGPSGVITTFAGDGTTTFKGDGGPAPLASLNAAEHIATDAAGNVYISDRDHKRVRKVNLGGVITTVAGTGSGNGPLGDGGEAILASLSDPAGIAVDAAGNLFILDRGHERVRKVAPNGIITTVVGTGAAGFSGDGGPASLAQINSAIGIALDSSGNLYIADTYNYRVRKVNTTGTITTVAGNGSQGFSGDGAGATSATLNFPTGVAVDSTGAIFIADHNNQRVRKVGTDGVIQTVAGTGNTGFSGDGGQAIFAQLHDTGNVTVDSTGNLWIADFGNYRVRKLTPAGIISTVAGNGSSGFFGDGGPATSAAIKPVDIAVDTTGNFFIADFDNNRIRKVFYAVPAVRRPRSQVTSQ